MPSMIPENPNPQAIKLFRILKILAIFQLGFGILNLFIDLSSGFYVMIGALLLYMIPCGRNWCTCVMYIILCLMDGISVAFMLGNYFTNHNRIESQFGVYLTISMLKIPFYVVTMFYSFLTYRELKAIYIEISMGSDSHPAQNSSPQQPQPFYGPGYVLG